MDLLVHIMLLLVETLFLAAPLILKTLMHQLLALMGFYLPLFEDLTLPVRLLLAHLR